MQKKVTEVQDRKTQLDSNSKEAVGKLKDTFQMLESIEETCTGPLSHKRLMEKVEAVKKSKAHVRDALSNVKNYIHVEFTESKIANKTIAELCGQVTDDIQKLKDCTVKGTNKEGKKQQMLGEEEADDSREVLSQQRAEESTENEVEDVGSGVSVHDTGDDAVKMMKTKLTRKRKTNDTREKESVADSSSQEKDATSQTTPLGNQPDRRSLTKGSDTLNSKSLSRESDTPNGKSFTRGTGNGDLPMSSTGVRDDNPAIRPGSKGPPAKRTRWDVTPESATIKFKSEGNFYCVIYLFPCHRLVMIILVFQCTYMCLSL